MGLEESRGGMLVVMSDHMASRRQRQGRERELQKNKSSSTKDAHAIEFTSRCGVGVEREKGDAVQGMR